MFRSFIKMNKFLSFLVIILFLSYGVHSQERTWKIFSPPSGEWSIIAPGTLTSDTDTGKASSKLVGYDYKDKTGFFAVIYRGVSKVPKKTKSYFDKTRDEAVKGVTGRLIKEEDFTNGSITGREIYIQIDYGRVERARMFFHGKRFYTVLAILTGDQVHTDEINTYFNSFTAR